MEQLMKLEDNFHFLCVDVELTQEVLENSIGTTNTTKKLLTVYFRKDFPKYILKIKATSNIKICQA